MKNGSSFSKRTIFTQGGSADIDQPLTSGRKVQLAQGPLSSVVERAVHIGDGVGSTPTAATKTFLLVPLSRGMTAKIDPDDGLLVAPYKWSANQTTPGRFYAQAKDDDGRNIYLHRLVLGTPDGVLADHINGDTLDCRKANLRLANHTQNAGNQRRRVSATGFCGVSLRKGLRFQAKIRHNREFIHLGYFDNPEDAARAYDSAAIQLRGEFAVLNFPKRQA